MRSHLLEVLEKKINRAFSDDDVVLPQWIFDFVDTLACKIIEKDHRLAYRSLQPSAMYALGIILSEWILHITGTTIESIDETIDTWSGISKFYDELLAKKNRIRSLKLSNVVSTIPQSHQMGEEQRLEAEKILSEIQDFRTNERMGRIQRENAEEELPEPQNLAKDILSAVYYEKFKRHVNEELYSQPAPDRGVDFYSWLEWSKNRWRYNRYLKKYQKQEEASRQKRATSVSYLLAKKRDHENYLKKRERIRAQKREEVKQEKFKSSFEKHKLAALRQLAAAEQRRKEALKLQIHSDRSVLVKRKRTSMESTSPRSKVRKLVHDKD